MRTSEKRTIEIRRSQEPVYKTEKAFNLKGESSLPINDVQSFGVIFSALKNSNGNHFCWHLIGGSLVKITLCQSGV